MNAGRNAAIRFANCKHPAAGRLLVAFALLQLTFTIAGAASGRAMDAHIKDVRVALASNRPKAAMLKKKYFHFANKFGARFAAKNVCFPKKKNLLWLMSTKSIQHTRFFFVENTLAADCNLRDDDRRRCHSTMTTRRCVCRRAAALRRPQT